MGADRSTPGSRTVTLRLGRPGRPAAGTTRDPRAAALIEYDNTQNGANHIHSVWRDLTNDWGEDALAAHYRQGHAATTPE